MTSRPQGTSTTMGLPSQYQLHKELYGDEAATYQPTRFELMLSVSELRTMRQEMEELKDETDRLRVKLEVAENRNSILSAKIAMLMDVINRDRV